MKFEIVEVQPGKFRLQHIIAHTRTETVFRRTQGKWWQRPRYLRDTIQIPDKRTVTISARKLLVISGCLNVKDYFPTAEAAEQCAREYADRVNNYPKTVKTFEI